MRGLALPLALALAACGAESGTPREQAERRVAEDFPEPADPLALPPVETLAGEWRVAGIDGAALDQPNGIALSATGSEIWWEPRCAGIVRLYRIDGPAITLEPPPPATPTGHDGVPVPPPGICTLGLPPGVEAMSEALDAVDMAERTPENGIRLSGNGHSVTIFAQ